MNNSKTKYVLESGNISSHPKLRKQFHTELVKGLNDEPSFLICAFAKLRESWEETYKHYSELIKDDVPRSVKLRFTLAVPQTFEQQCKEADVIYIGGGDDHLVQYWMKQFDLPAIFRNKVIASNSAGTNMLVQSFWTCDWRECMDGLGILPIKFIAHYLSDYGKDEPKGQIDWQKAYDDLQGYGDSSLPIHALKEGEFIVI